MLVAIWKNWFSSGGGFRLVSIRAVMALVLEGLVTLLEQ